MRDISNGVRGAVFLELELLDSGFSDDRLSFEVVSCPGSPCCLDKLVLYLIRRNACSTAVATSSGDFGSSHS